MKITMIEEATIYHIQLIHPDYGSEFHSVAVSSDLPLFATDEEYDEYNKALIEMLRDKYNKYGYWHEMIVTAEYVIDGKVYNIEIKEAE